MWPATMFIIGQKKRFRFTRNMERNKDSSGEYSAVRAFSAGLSLQF